MNFFFNLWRRLPKIVISHRDMYQIYETSVIEPDKVGIDLECETRSLTATECESGTFTSKESKTLRGVDFPTLTLYRVIM